MPELPSALDLTRAQFDGWACVWCSTPLRKGAVSAGRAEGRMGAHDLSIEVYACPECGPDGLGQATTVPPQGGTTCPSVPAATSPSRANRKSTSSPRRRGPAAP